MNGAAFTVAEAALWIGALALSLRAPLLIEARRRDAAIFFVLGALALALHFAIPLGPVDFGEAERLQTVWMTGLEQDVATEGSYASVVVLMKLAREVGVSPATLLYSVGPIAAALAVPLTFAAARAGGLSLGSSVLAALVLLGWPAHLRYGTAALPSLAPTVWVGVYAAALSAALGPWWKVVIVGAGMVFGIYCRPEMALLVFASLPLVFGAGWQWRHRLALAAMVVPAAVPWLVERLHTPSNQVGYGWPVFLLWLLRDWGMNPTWWIVAALAGLVAGRARRALRLCLLLTVALLGFAYSRYAAEENPLWGVWRNLVVLTPFAALAAATFVERLSDGGRRRGVLVGALTLAVGGGLLERRAVTRPVDGQAEHAFVRQSAPRVVKTHGDLVILTNADLDAEDLQFRDYLRGVTLDGNLRAALWTGVGAHEVRRCGSRADGSAAPRLWSLDALAPQCQAGPVIANAALYLGLFRPAGVIARLERRYRLEPIEERTVTAAPAMQFVDTQCPLHRDALPGSRLADCSLRLGWYRLIPR